MIGAVSRCLTRCEVKYGTTEKELLAIVYSVEKFRVYLLGIRFVIITDHQCLTFLNKTVFQKSRITRWTLLLQQYNFGVEYRRRIDNVVADFFSRNPKGKFEEDISEKLIISALHQCFLPVENGSEETALLIIALLNCDKNVNQSFKELSRLQQADPQIRKAVEECEMDSDLSTYRVHENILFHRGKQGEWKIVIPAVPQRSLIEAIHLKLGHPGVFKTHSHLKKFYYWKGLSAQVKQLVTSCDMCQRVKYLSISMEGEYNCVTSERPNDLVTVDFYGPLPRARGGMQYIFVLLDAFSKHVTLYPMKNATVRMTLKKIFTQFIPKFGTPKRILSDHGSQFTSHLWKTELESNNIKVLYSSIRHPQSNPTERVMRELGRLFRTLCADRHTNRVEYIPDIEKVLNITVHQSTKFSPLELHFGKPIQEDIHKMINSPPSRALSHEYLISLAHENIQKSFESRKKAQKQGSKVELAIGDTVLLRVRHLSNALDKVIQKFFHLFEGPYVILKQIGQNAFVLGDPKNNLAEIGTYNRLNLRKYYAPVVDAAVDVEEV